MTNPSTRWDLVPVWGAYFKGDGMTPVTGSLRLTFMQRVTRVDGRLVYPEGHVIERTIGDADADPATRDAVRAVWRAADESAAVAAGGVFDGAAWDAWWNVWVTGAVFAGFPASDDPDIVETGYQVKVEERFTSGTGKVFYVEPLLVHLNSTPPGINLATVAVPPGSPTAPAPIYAKGIAGGVAGLDADGDVVDAAGMKIRGAVGSVNGQTGAVTIAVPDSPDDIGAQPAGDYVVEGDPRLADARPPAPHGHVVSDLTDTTATGRSVLTAADPDAARTALGAGTSNLAIGTAAGTAAAGNDPRLSDSRIPADASVTDVKVSAGAAISLDKTADSATRLALTAAERSEIALIQDKQDAASLDSTVGGLVSNDTSSVHLALKAASVAAVEAEATVNPTGAWDFDQAPTVAGQPIGGSPPAVAFINAADYGWGTEATPAANDAALAAAIADAKPQRLDVYLGSGTFQVASTIDLKPSADGTFFGGVGLFGAGVAATTIENVSNSSDLLAVGGFFAHHRDFTIRHTNFTPDANTGDGIVFYKAAYSTFDRITVENCGRSLYIAQTNVIEPGTTTGAGNYLFSCQFNDIIVRRYSVSGLHLHAYSFRSTGSVWNNIYVQNQAIDGSPAPSSGTPVDLFLLEESTFNQLNIEDHAGTNIGILHNSGGVVVFNGVHFERVHLTGWQPQYIRVYGNASAVVTSVAVGFADVAPAAGSDHCRLFSVGGGAQLRVLGYSLNTVTKGQAGQTFTIAEVDDVHAANVMEIGYGVSENAVAFSQDTRNATRSNPGMKRIGDQMYATGSAVRATIKTAAYTLTTGDAGSVIEVNAAGAVTITAPASVLAPGAVVEIVQMGAGQVAIAAGSGMTLRTSSSLTTRAQYSSVILRARSSSEAVVSGDLT